MLSITLPQNQFSRHLASFQVSRLVPYVNAILIIWLAWLLAQLTWGLVPSSDEPAAVVVPENPVVQRKAARIDERQIAQWHVFGVASSETAEKKPTPVDAPDTQLNLTLRGLFSSDDSKESLAIIADPRGKEEHYSIGDPLPGGARLSEIHDDRIILERNGRFETLRLPKKKMSLGEAASRSNLSAVPRQAAPSPAGQASAFNRYRNEIKQNPSAFLNYVRATPARQNGKFVGFRLQPGKQRGAMQELGLQPGDIVTAINGVDIDSPAAGMKAMQSLGQGDSVSVTLLRKGQETSMSLALPAQ